MRIPTGPAVILVLAFAVRIGFVLILDPPLRSDEVDFDRLAWNLARTGSYSEEGIPTAYRPVGYPAFLAAIYRVAGHHPFAVRFVQVLLDVGTVGLLFRVAARRGRVAARLAASVWALYPPAILYTGFLIPETLFTFVLFGFLVLFDLGADRSRWRAAFHGVLLGVLILIRPATAAFLILLPMLWVSLRLRWQPLALFACGVILVLAPWIVRNARSVGAPVLTTNLGSNLLIGNHPGATGGYAPEVPPEMLPRRGHEQEENAASRDAALRYIAHDPGAFLWRGLRKLAYLASAEGEIVVYAFHENPADPGTRFREKYRSIPAAAHIAVSLPYALLVLLAVLGLCTRPPDALGSAFLALLLSWALIHFVFFGAGRFHFPLMPCLTLFASELVAGGWDRVRQLPARVWGVVLSAWALLALVWISEVSVVAGG